MYATEKPEKRLFVIHQILLVTTDLSLLGQIPGWIARGKQGLFTCDAVALVSLLPYNEAT